MPVPRKAASGRKGKGAKVSAYNVFIRTQLAQPKHEHPDMEHRERFKRAQLRWASAPENPKNR